MRRAPFFASLARLVPLLLRSPPAIAQPSAEQTPDTGLVEPAPQQAPENPRPSAPNGGGTEAPDGSVGQLETLPQAPSPAWQDDAGVAPEPAPTAPVPDYKTVVGGDREKTVKSASFTDTPWIELPQSVQSIDSRSLQTWGATTPNDAWKLSSGIFPSDQDLQSRYGGLGTMRGYHGSQTTLNGFTMPQRMSLCYDLSSVSSIDILKCARPYCAAPGAQVRSPSPAEDAEDHGLMTFGKPLRRCAATARGALPRRRPWAAVAARNAQIVGPERAWPLRLVAGPQWSA